MMNLTGLPLDISECLNFADDSYTQKTICVDEVEVYVQTIKRGAGPLQIVAPRGTEGGELISGGGWQDVWRDLQAWPSYDDRVGWSHHGFLSGAIGVYEHGLYGLLRRELPIVVIGHSMGAGIGMNLIPLMAGNGFNVIAGVFFGAPRTFTKGAVKRFERKWDIPIWEFSNLGDPVPDVPLRIWGYRHVREIRTHHRRDGYSVTHNHSMACYREAFLNA